MADYLNDGKGRGKWRVNVVKAANKVEGQSGAGAYDDQLAEVLRGRDVFRFRNFLAATGRPLPDDMMLDTLKMATLMHQLILTMPQLSDLHEFSRQWMDDNTVLTSKKTSLNQAALRQPGQLDDADIPAPAQGRRTISLRPLPPNRN